MNYIVPVMIISVAFNTPKYFEIETYEMKSTNRNESSIENDQDVIVSVKATDLRMNDDYIFYYNNLAKLIITGVVPFAALCVFNSKVLRFWFLQYYSDVTVTPQDGRWR